MRTTFSVFLDHLDIARVAIIGASMGGKTAIDFALGHPDRVSALVVVAAAMSGYRFVDADTIANWEAVDRAMEDGRLEDAAELELAQWVAGPRRKLEQISPAIRELVRDMLLTGYHTPPDPGHEAPMQPPALGRLGELTMPTMVIAGDQGAPDILRIADLLHLELPPPARSSCPAWPTCRTWKIQRPSIGLFWVFLPGFNPSARKIGHAAYGGRIAESCAMTLADTARGTHAVV